MDPATLNTRIIASVRGLLPPQLPLIRFLTDTLPLGREAIYRRLRGEVFFSFAEVCAISRKLGVSVEFLAQSPSQGSALFELILQKFQDNREGVTAESSKFEQLLAYILADPLSKFELSHNLFPQVPTHLFYHLSKYNSFKWVYKNRTAQATPFKQVEYSRDIFEMHRDNNMATMNIRETSYIWDYTIIEMLVREIRYFADINLLDSEDIALLKEELHEFLSYVEGLAIQGTFPTGNKLDIYISAMNSDAAYSYMESSCYKLCIVGVFNLQYIISTDALAFDLAKENIRSLKKGATLISGNNEMYRVAFFRKQHELVNTL